MEVFLYFKIVQYLSKYSLLSYWARLHFNYL